MMKEIPINLSLIKKKILLILGNKKDPFTLKLDEFSHRLYGQFFSSNQSSNSTISTIVSSTGQVGCP